MFILGGTTVSTQKQAEDATHDPYLLQRNCLARMWVLRIFILHARTCWQRKNLDFDCRCILRTWTLGVGAGGGGWRDLFRMSLAFRRCLAQAMLASSSAPKAKSSAAEAVSWRLAEHRALDDDQWRQGFECRCHPRPRQRRGKAKGQGGHATGVL